MVLVVGSHEPRKNHLAVLEAAEQLWSHGIWFDLVFIGGSGWQSDDVEREVGRLLALGRPICVRRRSSERELWAAYRLAKFTVFPSLLEGYGLPIVESMACGTPVITSNYGSMAEIAEGGGAIMIDPRDSTQLAAAMRAMFDDDELLAGLRAAAAARSWPNWDDYSRDVWQFLVAPETSLELDDAYVDPA